LLQQFSNLERARNPPAVSECGRTARAGEDHWQQPSGNRTVDVPGDCLRRRWHEGCHNGIRLWREFRERGFAGRPSTVRDRIRRLRGANPQPAGLAPAWKTPSGRRAVWLVVADADEIDGPERKFVDALIAGSAELAHLIALARETRATIRERREERLDGQLVAAEETTFAGFAGGLRRDLAALLPSCPELISLVFEKDCIKRFRKKIYC
jgi:transposase